MKSFYAFYRKELLGSFRTAKIWVLAAIALFLGITNPIIAKITPWLLEFLSDSLAETGMQITVVGVTAFDSWAQFFGNISILLIPFVFLYGNSFSSEYGSGTLVLLLTKGYKRYKVVLAKTLNLVLVWTVSYFLSFLSTWLLTVLMFDNSIVSSLGAAVWYWWLFGILVIAATVFFSVLFRGYGFVLLGVGGFVFLSYLLALWKKIADFVPVSLTNGLYIVYGMEEPSAYIGACVVSIVLSVAAIVGSVFLFNKKEI